MIFLFAITWTKLTTIGGYRDIMKQMEDVITIEEKNHIDELTGLHNLTGILEHLQGHDGSRPRE